MRHFKKIHTGFALLEVIAGLLVLVIATSLGWTYQNAQAEDNLNAATSQYQNILTKASEKYISDNYDAVLSAATATTPAVITVQMLKTTNYLPSSFGNVGPRGQTYQLYAIKPSANKLESILVSSGGAAISDKNLVQIANKSGATAGYIQSSSPGIIKGVYGTWSTALSNYKIGNNAGHLASALFFTDGQVDNDYLYRSAVSGHPEVNRMNTAIDLNGNDLNNVKTANTTTLNSTTTNTSAETYTGGWFRTTGDGGIYFSKYGGGWSMSDTGTIRAYGNKNVQTAGGLYGGYVNSTGSIDASGNITGNGTVTGGSVYSRSNVQAAGNVLANGYLYSGLVAVANTGCPANGAVAREAAGSPLFCQSGVWSGTQNNGRYIGLGSYTSQYNGYNSTTGTVTVYALGGNSIVYKDLGDGQGCTNTWALTGYAGGVAAAVASDNNPAWAKSGTITFQVPANTSYSIVSNPLPSQGCSPGNFSVYVYQ